MGLFGKYLAYCYICGTRMDSTGMIGRRQRVCSVKCLRELERVEARSILGKDSCPHQRHLEAP